MLKDFQLIVAAAIIGVSLIVASHNCSQLWRSSLADNHRYSFHLEKDSPTFGYVFDKQTGKIYQWSFDRKSDKVQYLMRDLIHGEDRVLNP